MKKDKVHTKSETPLIDYFDKSFKRTPLLKFNGLEKKDVVKSLKQFIFDMFNNYNKQYPTVKARSNKYVCDLNRHRSLNDIYALCRYYIDGTTLKDVLKVIHELVKEKSIQGYWNCCTIKRYVFNSYSMHYRPGIQNHRIYENNEVLIHNLFKELKLNTDI